MIEICFGLLIAVSVFLILDHDLCRRVFGIVLLSTVINLVLLFSGKLTHKLPAFVNDVPTEQLSNPVPQALILTAIVIGFGLLIFLCVLIRVLKKS